MIHLLIIAADSLTLPPFAASEPSAELKSLRKPDLAAARPLLEAGLFDACLWVTGTFSSREQEAVGEFRNLAARCPLLIALPQSSADDERAAYRAGADVVLTGPLEKASLPALIQRLVSRTTRPGPPLPIREAPAVPAFSSSALAVMRDFSQIFSYSLDYQEFTRHFVIKLREIIGATRVAIFIEPPPPVGALGPGASREARLACVGAVGLPAELVECIELSRVSGLGRHILQSGRILRLGAESTVPFLAEDPRIQREFEILGCEIAVPVNDRERTLGVALIGGRLTGVPFSDAELLLVFHLLEELGLAVKNSWLHREVSTSHRLFADVLGAMTGGALVVDSNLAVLFANQAFRRHLWGDRAADYTSLDISGLPPLLGSSLHEVVEKGQSMSPFIYEHPGAPPRVFHVTIVPLRREGQKLPQPALLLLEDFTQVRAAQRAEIEASNLKLIGLIAKRFAHEIRNSLVPLTTHEQLFDTDYANAEFRDSLRRALSRETSRIQRFTEQMLFLAQGEGGVTDVLSLEDLLQKSFARSREFLGEAGELVIQSELSNPRLRCHRPSLLHALQEIFLNGLQSAGAPPRVSITISGEVEADGRPGLALSVHDNGRGFSADVAARAADPFFTTRNTGVGLGLTVAKRVIEAHAGRLEIQPRKKPEDPDLVIHLPLNL